MVIPAGPATRRTVLKASLAGLGGLGGAVLTGCAPKLRLRVPPQAVGPDVTLLNQALALEQRTIAAYTAIAPLLGGFASTAAGRFLDQELLHAGELRKQISALGGRPHNPLTHYDFGKPGSRMALLALLHALERRQIAVYLHAIPRMHSPEVRQSLASILANDAQHLLVLRDEQGITAMPGPLVTAAE